MDSESDSDGTTVSLTDSVKNGNWLGLGGGENEFDDGNVKDGVNVLDRVNGDVPENETERSNGDWLNAAESEKVDDAMK
jgi:hypothetical protein